jgi:spore maturation protein CgeB
LVSEQGDDAELAFRTTYPELDARFYDSVAVLEQVLGDADVVIVHEWTDADVVEAVGKLRRANRFILLFHDTHHRAVSEPDAMRRYDLTNYDGVLAFGVTLAEIYRKWGWGDRVYVWHEAADTTVFHPPVGPVPREGAVWVGNWGDGEREAEIERYLLLPSKEARLRLDVYGVRYPADALTMLDRYGARYHGWVANVTVPDLFAMHAMTVHVPRCFYSRSLPGIPTIRVFEALACGIPLISAPWSDVENLFQPGVDYLTADSASEMSRQMIRLQNEPGLAESIAASGRERIVARHSCDIRAEELLAILAGIMRSPCASAS